MKNEIDEQPVVAFITDFGIKDSYVSEMHASILRECPYVRLIDITHLVQRGEIRSAAYLLWRAHGHFPQSTIFVAVVDPGVGSDRQAVVIKTKDYLFVGPDNGVFSRIIDMDLPVQVRLINNRDIKDRTGSMTFHGRDIFAPVAGRLANGAGFEEIGKPGRLLHTSPPAAPRLCKGGLEGEIVYIDHFGNATTNLPGAQAGFIELMTDHRLTRSDNYCSRETGECFWLVGSDGNIEIAINCGNAARALGIKIGDPIRFLIENEEN